MNGICIGESRQIVISRERTILTMIFFFLRRRSRFCIKGLFQKTSWQPQNINIAETGNIKKEGNLKKKKIENSQTKMADRNTRTKKQWRYRTIGKQKIKWHD